MISKIILSATERLIVCNQIEIIKQLEIMNGTNANSCVNESLICYQQALRHGYVDEYQSYITDFVGIDIEPIDPTKQKHVRDILCMYKDLGDSYRMLLPIDQADINYELCKFVGFTRALHPSHLSEREEFAFWLYLTDYTDQYENVLKDSKSHHGLYDDVPMLERYGRMLLKYNDIKKSKPVCAESWILTKDEILTIISN